MYTMCRCLFALFLLLIVRMILQVILFIKFILTYPSRVAVNCNN